MGKNKLAVSPRSAVNVPDISALAMRTEVLRRIYEHGFTVIYVGANEERPPYAYTVGLCARIKPQREIVVVGLSPDIAMRILNIVARRLMEGERMALNKDVNRILEGYPVRFVPISAKVFREHAPVANWYARRDLPKRDRRVSGLQLLWPDQRGRFPASEHFATHLTQPLLSTVQAPNP